MAKIKITETQLEKLMKENAKEITETQKQTVVEESINKEEEIVINEAVQKIMADFKRFK